MNRSTLPPTTERGFSPFSAFPSISLPSHFSFLLSFPSLCLSWRIMWGDQTLFPPPPPPVGPLKKKKKSPPVPLLPSFPLCASLPPLPYTRSGRPFGGTSSKNHQFNPPPHRTPNVSLLSLFLSAQKEKHGNSRKNPRSRR